MKESDAGRSQSWNESHEFTRAEMERLAVAGREQTEPVVKVSDVRRLLDLYERDMGSQVRWAFRRLCESADASSQSSS